jgi:N-acetylglucosaminyldiphosphoundecaprenol N-acetyl-beta-D-mannosaminyltransferase
MHNGRIELLRTQLDAIEFERVLERVDEAVAGGRPTLNASLNAAKVVRLQEDAELREAIAGCELITADGVPIVWAARLFGYDVPGRVNGTDLMEALLARAEERAWSVYLLGSREDVLTDARAEIVRRHPRLRIAGSHHGYFAAADEEAVVAEVAAARPDILFIALQTPEKELFQARHRAALGVPFVMGVGGSFEVLAGHRRRAPRWAQKTGLEWAFRLAQEPRRLARRYAVGNARFVALVVRELARSRFASRAEVSS